MRLTNATIDLINNTRTRTLIALAVERSEQTILYMVKKNRNNSLLTTSAALKVIREQTGLSDSEILTDDVSINSEISAQIKATA